MKSKPSLENQIQQLELQIKERELSIKDKEIEELKRKQITFRIFATPVFVGIMAAFLSLLGNLWATYQEGQNSLELERQRFQTSLILEAARTNDPQTALENLNFFISAGFIEDKDGKISAPIEDGGIIPLLPSEVRCDLSYPDVCIPPPPPSLDCTNINYRKFRVLPPDPHGFDSDRDGIGCEN